MAQSYTPGLTVADCMRVQKRRILPIKGKVLTETGLTLDAATIVAQTDLPGDVYPVNIANILGIGPKEVHAAMLKQQGEKVENNEVIAKSTSFFGLFKSYVHAPREGTIESISNVTGQVILRGDPLPVEVRAYIPGRVVEVLPDNGVVMECWATFIQGIFGIGGETTGKLVMGVSGPEQILEADALSESHRDCIVVGGALAKADTIRRAEEMGIRGIVVGGFDDRDLRDYLGYDLGVAITGSEDIKLTLIVTEGFGHIQMADKTFGLFKKNEGRSVSINGATQIRAGVIRPEVVIPIDSDMSKEKLRTTSQMGGLGLDSPVRCIREPYFGRIGRVTGMPSELQMLESETRVRVLSVRFEDGEEAMIPRANVEIIEGMI